LGCCGVSAAVSAGWWPPWRRVSFTIRVPLVGRWASAADHQLVPRQAEPELAASERHFMDRACARVIPGQPRRARTKCYVRPRAERCPSRSTTQAARGGAGACAGLALPLTLRRSETAICRVFPREATHAVVGLTSLAGRDPISLAGRRSGLRRRACVGRTVLPAWPRSAPRGWYGPGPARRMGCCPSPGAS
jgi:hypothetical protein